MKRTILFIHTKPSRPNAGLEAEGQPNSKKTFGNVQKVAEEEHA
jgi:hypothetical protein